MAVQMLNYTAHAIESLSRLASNISSSDRKGDVASLRWFCDVLAKAQKFRLPDGGRLFSSEPDKKLAIEKFQKEVDLLRLPFPEVIIEYSMPESLETIAHNAGLCGLESASMRIGVGLDVNSSCWDSCPSSRVQREIHNWRRLHSSGVVVASMFSDVSKSEWNPPFLAFIIDREQHVVAVSNFQSFNSASAELKGRLASIGVCDKAPAIALQPLILFDSISSFAVKEMFGGSMQRFVESELYNVSDEQNALIQFCAILNCANVSSSVVLASEKLNKKRVISKKIPLFDYRVLEIDTSGSEFNSKDRHRRSDPDGRCETRMHLRRGHIRRVGLSKGLIRPVWVNAAVVGSVKCGMVKKDYLVT